jgi:hypothetical protein
MSDKVFDFNGEDDRTPTRNLLRDRRFNQLNYTPANLNQQRTAENVSD